MPRIVNVPVKNPIPSHIIVTFLDFKVKGKNLDFSIKETGEKIAKQNNKPKMTGNYNNINLLSNSIES